MIRIPLWIFATIGVGATLWWVVGLWFAPLVFGQDRVEAVRERLSIANTAICRPDRLMPEKPAEPVAEETSDCETLVKVAVMTGGDLPNECQPTSTRD